MTNIKIIISLALVLFCTNILNAQISANSSGGDASGSGGTAAYTVGEVVYTSANGSTGNIEQGVQHAYTVSGVGISNPAYEIALNAYPIPTLNNLVINITKGYQENLRYRVTDMLGQIVHGGTIATAETVIEMHTLAAATYFVAVVNHKNQALKTFKVEKLTE